MADSIKQLIRSNKKFITRTKAVKKQGVKRGMFGKGYKG